MSEQRTLLEVTDLIKQYPVRSGLLRRWSVVRKGLHHRQERWSSSTSEPSFHCLDQPGEHVTLLPPTGCGEILITQGEWEKLE